MRGSGYPDYVKRMFDLVVILSAHVLLLPLWVFLWIVIPAAIALDSGLPIFYKSRRVGRYGQVFEAPKFRTMIQGADKLGPSMTVVNDSRVTRVGRILRKTGLDELPQLLCILRGDMTFVGPRALGEETHRLWVEEFPEFEDRLEAVPGLTGLATVLGQPDDDGGRLELDLRYVVERTLWLDLKLLFMSVWNTLRGRWERNKPTAAVVDSGRAPRSDSQELEQREAARLRRGHIRP